MCFSRSPNSPARYAPFVQRVHLVHADPLDVGGVRGGRVLEGVEHRRRLAVGERHDELCPGLHDVDDVGRHVGRGADGVERSDHSATVRGPAC